MVLVDNNGFSLIELMVVMAIMTLIVAIVPPFIPGVMDSMNMKSAARELASELKLAQTQAIHSQRETVLSVDIDQHTFHRNGKRTHLNIPAEGYISLIIADSERQSDKSGSIRFYPDGSSTGGQVKLAYQQQLYLVDVHWLTGKVRILP